MPEEATLRRDIDKAHRRDRFWAILFPVILVGLAAVALIVLLSVNAGSGGSKVAVFAGVAMVMLSLPALLFGLIKLAILIGLNVGVHKLHGLVPRGGEALRGYLKIARSYLRTGGDAAVKPVVALQSLSAKFNQIRASFSERFSQKGRNI